MIRRRKWSYDITAAVNPGDIPPRGDGTPIGSEDSDPTPSEEETMKGEIEAATGHSFSGDPTNEEIWKKCYKPGKDKKAVNKCVIKGLKESGETGAMKMAQDLERALGLIGTDVSLGF